MILKDRLLKYLKRKPLLLKLYRSRRDGHLFKKTIKKKIKGNKNSFKFDFSARFVNCTLNVEGNYNEILVGEDAFFRNVDFIIKGNNHRIQIDKKVQFNRGGSIWIQDENGTLQIGGNTTFEDAHIAVTEPNSKIIIGHNCMFANDIDIRTGDSHSILNTITNKRINFAQNVEIGSQVWVGAHVSILKGVKLLRNTVVATRSVVTKPFVRESILIGGIPARILKEDISWDRKLIYKDQLES